MYVKGNNETKQQTNVFYYCFIDLKEVQTDGAHSTTQVSDFIMSCSVIFNLKVRCYNMKCTSNDSVNDIC